MTEPLKKRPSGHWPKITRVPLNNVSEILISEEADGGITLQIRGSYVVYSVRQKAHVTRERKGSPSVLTHGTEIELEPRH